MSDTFSHVTNKSWFSRMGSAFGGIITGIILIIVASIMLFWNEGRAVKRDKTLNEGIGLVLSVKPETVIPANEGKLVHISGKAIVNDTLKDDLLNVSTKAIRLERIVEMLQWTEKTESKTREKIGGGTETTTVYRYELAWSNKMIDSAKFRHPSGHENTLSFPVSSKTVTAQNVTIGAFSLNPSQIARIGSLKNQPLTNDNIVNGKFGDKHPTIIDGVMYVGSQSRNKAGDIRITLKVAQPGNVSLVARQVEKSFRPYKTTVGGTISLLQNDIIPADEMFQTAVNANTTLTWVLRIAGFVMMLIGFKMTLRVLAVTASVIPILGSIVGGASTIVSFLLALIISFFIIAIAWVFYRPLVGFAILAVAIIAAFALVWRGKKSAPEPQMTTN